MSEALPNLLPLMTYPTEPFRAGRISKLKGAGKWTWAARKALKTLSRNQKVWIRAENNQQGIEFREAILNWREPLLEAIEDEYELRCYNTDNIDPVFGDFSFSHVVGLWLEYSERESAALLSPFISTEGFTFSPTEYIDLKDRIQAAIRRYERLPKVSRGLEDLNTGFFRHRSLEESQEFISKHVDMYLAKGDVLHRDFVLTINRHARAAIFARRVKLKEKRLALATFVTLCNTLEGTKGRAAKKSVKQLLNDWKGFCEQHSISGPSSSEETIPWLKEQLTKEKEELDQQEKTLFRDLKSAGLALNALTVLPHLGDANELKALEDRGRELLQEVDEAGLYQLPLGGINAATTQRQLQQLEGLLDKLRNTRHHLNELPAFYDRRQFWYAQPAHLRRVLAPLITLPPKDWDTAFSGWYFERCLERGLPAREVASEKAVQQASSPLPDKNTGERLILLPPEAPWPAQLEPKDLLISLSPQITLPAAPGCSCIVLAPLQDVSASHIALAGLRSPSLVMLQDFSPLSPPEWRAFPTSNPPPGQPPGRILLRKEAGDWQFLQKFRLSLTATIDVFFPAQITKEDQEELLLRWEEIISSGSSLNFHHNFTQDDLTKALLADGFSGFFLVAALIRAAEAAAAHPFDQEALMAMGREVRYRCGITAPSPHPLTEHLRGQLKILCPDFFFECHKPWRDTFLPLVSLSPAGKKTVFLPNGRLPGFADDRTEALRQRELKTSGFTCVSLDPMVIWSSPKRALQDLANQLS